MMGSRPWKILAFPFVPLKQRVEHVASFASREAAETALPQKQKQREWKGYRLSVRGPGIAGEPDA